MKIIFTLPIILFSLFLSSIAIAQSCVWAKSATGTGYDYGSGITTDASDNIIVTGAFRSDTITFGSTNFINADNNTSAFEDFFIAKYDPNGNVMWANSAGGSQNEFGIGITTDANENIFVTGGFSSDSVTFGNITLINNLMYYSDIFIAKYDPSGNVLWAKSEGGSAFDRGIGIDIDPAGNIIVLGDYRSDSITFGNNTLSNSSTANSDIFIVKYDDNGNVLWAKSAGGSGADFSNSLITDAGGNIIVTGYFDSDSISFGTITFSNSDTSGTLDFFMAKYDSNGNVLWGKSAGGSADDCGFGVTTDVAGNIIVTGYFKSDSITFDNITFTNSSSNSPDIFIVKYDSTGNLLWAKKAGGQFYDSGISVSSDTSGNIIVTGIFLSDSLSFDNTILINTSSDADIYTVKYDNNGNVLWAKNVGGSGYEESSSIITDTGGKIYLTGSFTSSLLTCGSSNLSNSGERDFLILKLMDSTTGIEDYTLEKTINIFPNPTTGEFVLTTTSESESLKLEVYSFLGEKVYCKALESIAQKIFLQVVPGIYFVKITDSEKAYTQKLIIQ